MLCSIEKHASALAFEHPRIISAPLFAGAKLTRASLQWAHIWYIFLFQTFMTVDEIATHIRAEKVIFQELDDLIDACRQAASSNHTARETQDFEVGGFNGQYVTPVPDGYFVHLERVRGENKKMKMIENARGAVANGSADPEEIRMATNGAEVKDDGSVVASGSLNAVNSNDPPLPNAKRKRTLEGQEKPKRTMDISMHNQDDFEVED